MRIGAGPRGRRQTSAEGERVVPVAGRAWISLGFTRAPRQRGAEAWGWTWLRPPLLDAGMGRQDAPQPAVAQPSKPRATPDVEANQCDAGAKGVVLQVL
jgi:hypothetical protein